jgi:hypothetical protein
MFTFQIKGLGNLFKTLNNYPKQVRKDVGNEMKAAAQEMAFGAKRDAPNDTGFLHGGISVVVKDHLNYEVVSRMDYSAFVEFGTRGKTRVPAGLENYAAQFRGQGDALKAREMIYEWCRRKGIDPTLWYPIYVSLMVRGVTPHPFFFKQFGPAKNNLMRNLKKIVK